MNTIKIKIPDESYALLNFKRENMPAVACVNISLRQEDLRPIFQWHLSVVIEFEDLIENGMPSKDERDIVEPFCDLLDREIKGNDLNKPNALFLARITWNKTRQMLWRVYDPEISNSYLQKIIKNKNYPREFDFYMQADPAWEYATYYLENYENDA